MILTDKVHQIFYIFATTKKTFAIHYTLLLYLIVISTINEKLVPCVFVNERTNQCPQNTKYPGRTHNQQPTHRLGVVTFNNFYHP